MASKQFLSVGNLLINPDLLAYAALEGAPDDPRLRLGFATPAGASGRAEFRLAGEDAGAAIRWLRLHATHLTREGAFGPVAGPVGAAASGPAVDRGAAPREGRHGADRAVLAR